MDRILPDYGGACVSRVVPALMGERREQWLPEPVRDASSVVLLVLDGLGWEQLRSHAARAPVMSSMAGGAITTVAPSTTAPALTSIATGRAPGLHGITGYRMRVSGSPVFNLLSWHALDGSPGPAPADVVPDAVAFDGRPVPVVTKAQFASSGLTKATLRGTGFHGWRTLGVLAETVRRLVAAGEPLVYAYYDGVDIVSHVHGVLDEFYPEELSVTDALVERLLGVLPSSAALCITADHGQIPLTADDWIEMSAVDAMVEEYAGDGRWRYLHARAGAAADLAAACKQAFSESAEVYTREELIASGLIGPLGRPEFAERIGDVTLVAGGNGAFATGGPAYLDPRLKVERGMLSGHGGLTSAEMLVPLIAARGTA